MVFACSLATAADASKKARSPLITTTSRLDDATLVAADADWNWTFKTANGGDRSFPAREVIRFGYFAVPKGQHRLRLVSGDEILGYAMSLADGQAVLESDLLDVVKAPIEAVAAMILDTPTDPAVIQPLEARIAGASATDDTLLFANGDQLAGRLVAIASDKVTLASANREILVDRARLAAVVLKRTKPKHDADRELKTWVGLRDGSRLLAHRFSIQDDLATIQLAGDTKTSLARNDIVALQPLGGDAVYLSDLDDSGYRHIPFLSLAWDYQRDGNVLGGPLVADGRLYLKGLGMHSAARMTYNLDADYRRFQCDLAIDDSTAGRGSVTCRVYTDDGAGKWQMKYESPIIRGGDKPTPIDIELSGAKRISLLVDFADRGDEQDHADWLEARVIK